MQACSGISEKLYPAWSQLKASKLVHGSEKQGHTSGLLWVLKYSTGK